MFLGVSANLRDVDMTREDRERLAAQVTARRKAEFGTRSAAYRAANLNSGTWKRIEDGDKVREDRLVAAVGTLWPASGGDWRKVGEPDADEPPSLRDLQARIESLESRVGRIEQAGSSPADLTDIKPEVTTSDKLSDEADVQQPVARRGRGRRR